MHTICYLPACICFMCSDMLTCMFYVFGHAYMYVLCVRTCLHVCFMCSDMLTCMFYVFGHAYMYVLCVRTGLFYYQSNAKKLPFINFFYKFVFNFDFRFIISRNI